MFTDHMWIFEVLLMVFLSGCASINFVRALEIKEVNHRNWYITMRALEIIALVLLFIFFC